MGSDSHPAQIEPREFQSNALKLRQCVRLNRSEKICKTGAHAWFQIPHLLLFHLSEEQEHRDRKGDDGISEYPEEVREYFSEIS